MKKLVLIFAIITIYFIGLNAANAAQTSSISQWGITWYFDKDYTYGQFANGDYWILGPVTITSITPAFDGYNNGWEVNPTVSGDGHGFQDGGKNGGFDPGLVPDLPYTSPESGIVSIVKTVASGLSQPCVQTAAVLTVVTETPPDNGRSVFRPPYVGTSKPYYYVDDLRTDLLPSYSPVGTPPTLSYFEDKFKRLRLDHKNVSYNRSLRPADSMEDYQPKNSQDIINAALRFMLNDSVETKKPALIQYVQAGVDKVHSILLGMIWFPADGHETTHLIHASFTATMLDITDLNDTLNNATFFHASKYLASSTASGLNLWGEWSLESQYWNYIRGLGGSRSNKDPYGFIDGGKCGWDYQIITSQSHKGEALAAKLMPALTNAWPEGDLSYATNYAERYVNVGVWSQPDPCAPYDDNPDNYGITYGPDPENPGMCILDPDLAYYNGPEDFACKPEEECGRYPEKHGTFADEGQYKSVFVETMWNAYWGSAKPAQPTGVIVK